MERLGLLSGRLLAGQPQLYNGASAFITADLPDGGREIVAWTRNFDPDCAETYWAPHAAGFAASQ